MSENKEYWKELLGDDFDLEMFTDIIDSSNNESGGEPGKTENGKDSQTQVYDSGRFVDVPISDFPLSAVPGKSISDSGKPDKGADKNADNFKINFDFDSEYSDPKPELGVRHPHQRRTGCLGGILYFLFIVGLSFLLACLCWMAATDVLGLGKKDSEISVTVEKGFTIKEITDMLYDNGFIKYKGLFKIYADISSADKKITAGTYMLNTSFDYRALVHGMTATGGTKVEVSVTIPEGYSLKQIIDLLVSNKVCSEEDLWDTVTNYDFDYDFLDSATLGDSKRLEGYLFPDTYDFYVNDKPERVIAKFLDDFEVRFTDDYKARAEELGYSVKEILTIASLIEKEAVGEEDRATIASVIYNRLNSSDYGYLQLDSTIYYIIAETGEAFSTDIDSPYNTYKVEGLPAGPIANPGIATIEAALNPEDTNYYFYALGVDGAHHFFNSYNSFTDFVNSDEYASE